MKYSIILGLFCIVADFSCNDNYKKFPPNFDEPDSLIKTITPGKNYTYWAFCDWNHHIIYSHGEKPADVNFNFSRGSDLFVSYRMLYNCRYIEFIKDGKVGYVTDTDAFKIFLLPINNLRKAALLAECDGHLEIDEDHREGGSYMIKDGIYDLKFAFETSCPEIRRSVYISIKPDSGIVKKENLGAYYKNNNCVVF